MANKRKPNKTTPKRKRQIMEAALSCFNENGFTDTSMQEIRQRAGASYGSVYHHFKSKELLAAAVYLEGLQDYQEGMISLFEKEPGPREGVCEMVRRHLAWVESNASWAKFLINMRHADFMRDAETLIGLRNQEFIPIVGQFLNKHIGEGSIRNLPRDVCISIILGPCQEFTRLWIEGLAFTDMEQAMEQMGESAWQALKPKG
ncbi:MAG: TetR/AcrR family transcriptional regulator [Desulfatibacillum sp.]|nr:TetR/AcrR family transcriptional regulator [Desulfatibacillum sp.]